MDGLNSSCLASDRYQHDIEAKSVNQSKMAAKAWNDLASPINAHGISQNPPDWKTQRK